MGLGGRCTRARARMPTLTWLFRLHREGYAFSKVWATWAIFLTNTTSRRGAV